MAHIQRLVLRVLIYLSVSFSVARADIIETSAKNVTFDVFQKLFKHKRLLQLEAISGLVNLPKYEAKYDIVNRMFDKIFELQDRSWGLIENSDFIPGGEDFMAEPPLPQDPVVRESLSTLVENCALIGDLILRLPDITQRLLKKKPEWMISVKHCLTFCKSTRLLDSVTEEMLNLAAQELQLIPRSADFTNPYREKDEAKSKKQRANSRKLEL